MPAPSTRSAGYKAGLVVLFLSSIVFLIGLASPYWATARQVLRSGATTLVLSYHEGLWVICATAEISAASRTLCDAYGVAGLPIWFHAVRSLTILCAMGLLVACVYALVINCRSSPNSSHSRFLESFASAAGILGFSGSMVYLRLRNLKLASSNGSTQTVSVLTNLSWTFSWAFYMAVAGSALSFIAAVIIGCSNKPATTGAHNANGGDRVIANESVSMSVYGRSTRPPV